MATPRFYARLEIKALTEAEDPNQPMTLEGIASTPATDRMGDIVESEGAEIALPIPLLYQHSTLRPIGLVTYAKPTKDGIPFRATVDSPDPAVPYIAEARAHLRAKRIRGISIGFRSLEDEPINPKLPWDGTRFKRWEMMELSTVTIPANAEATIHAIKNFDCEDVPAATGRNSRSSASSTSPGVAGSSSKGVKVKTVKEMITGFEATRQANEARMEELMGASATEARVLDEEEAVEYEDLEAKNKSIDDHLVRLRRREKTLAETATPLPASAGEDPDVATPARAGRIYMGKQQLAPGVRFARYAMCIARAKGNLPQAEILSRQFMDSSPEVNLALKAAVAAGTTQDATWASPLVQLQEMASEFVDFLRPQTIIGRLNLRRVPFNIKFTRQTSGTTGHFVGEGLPKPLGKMDFELLSLPWAKAATIIIMTEELMRFSNPASELLARDDLGAGIAQFLDKRFIDPVYAGVVNVSPASITNGITPIPSSGNTIANITDTAALAIGQLIAADLNPANFVWIMNPTVALDLSLKRTAQDIFAFPTITAQGGTFLGYPVITSNNVVLSGSPSESFVVLLDQSNVLLADDGGASIDMSAEASVEMSDTPTGGATSLVSLWQNNLLGLRAERFIYWKRRRETAVAVVTMNVKW